jgi:RimJ/RimL family protein N-acetyltransferase
LDRRTGRTLLVVERDHDQAVGLMILGELDLDDDPAVEVRLGYLLAEWGWGKGLASELVGGFLDWCRHLPDPLRVIAGVAQSNAASARVLLGNGFVPVGTGDDAGSQTYEILIGARSER